MTINPYPVDLFGNKIPDSAPIKKAPEKEGYDYETCWEDCKFIGDQLHNHRHLDPRWRHYKLCTQPTAYGTKCFKSNAICALVARVEKPQPVRTFKPDTPGWEDY